MLNANIKKLLLHLLFILSMPLVAMNNNLGNNIEEYIYNKTYIYNLPAVEVIGEITISTKILELARLINSEAGNQDDDGQIAVGNVVINIAREKGWSLNKTIHDRNKYGPRFDGVDTNRFKEYPSKRAILNAAKSFSIKVVPDDVQFFHNPKTSTDGKWVRYIEQFTWGDIGDHRFCSNPKSKLNGNKQNFQ